MQEHMLLMVFIAEIVQLELHQQKELKA